MRKSECFEHDIDVRQNWVGHLTDDQRTSILGVEKERRFELYQAIDQLVKEKYMGSLVEANAEQEVIHIKGFGPVRQSKNQLPLDMRLNSAAYDVIEELDIEALVKPIPVVSEVVNEDQ